MNMPTLCLHDDVIKWKHFPRYWPFVRGSHQWPVKSPHIGQWRGALIFSLICAWINGWVNNGEAGDLRSHRTHYDIVVIVCGLKPSDFTDHLNTHKSKRTSKHPCAHFLLHNVNVLCNASWPIIVSMTSNLCCNYLKAWSRHNFNI